MNKLLEYRTVGIWLFSLSIMLIWVSKNILVQSDLSLFLPKQQSFIDSLLVHQLNEGSASRTIFISIEGSALQQRTRMSHQLVEKLQKSPFFEQVFNGTQQLSEGDINWLLRNRYLLSADIREGHFSAGQLKAALQQRLDELSLPVPSVDKKYLPRDPSAELRSILKRVDKKKTLNKHEGVWVSEDSEQAIIITQTAASAVNLDKQQQVVDFIQSSFQLLNDDGMLNLQLTGLPVASTLSRKLIQAESRWFSLAASLALLIILYLGFRSGKLVLLSSLPLFSAVITGLFTVLLWFNSIHGITLVFAITILGIAIDYPLHLFSHLDPKRSSSSSVKKIWSTMKTGLLTTVTAFLTLVFSNFDGLFQLGLFTASGLVMAALTTRFILPVLIGETRIGFQSKIKPVTFSKSQGLITITLGLLFCVAVFLQQVPQWEKNLSSLSPLPDSYVKRDKQLRSMLSAGDLRYIALVQGGSMEQVLQKSEQLQPVLEQLVQQKTIQNYDMAANYMPSQSLQSERKSSLPTRLQLDQNLSEAVSELPFKKGLFQPFVDDVERTRQLPGIKLDDLDGLPFELVVKSLLLEQSKKYYGIIRFSGLKNVDILQQQIKSEVIENTVTVHDLQQISSTLLIQFYADFLIRVMVAIFIIILILLISLRHLQRTLTVISVLLLSLLVEIAILVALGHHFTLFHLVSLILVFGLGLDYALFFTREESATEKQKTFYGLLICAFSSLIVFGILALSNIPVLHIIGMTTALGVLLAFIFSMLMTSLVLKDK